MEGRQEEDQRIDALGDRLIAIVDEEQDPAIVLSALAFITAASCAVMAGDQQEGTETAVEGFIRILRGIVSNGRNPRVVH